MVSRAGPRVGAPLLALAALLLLPATARAGGTGVEMTLVPVPAVCGLGGACRNGKAGACSADADCSVGTVASKSKLSFGGKKLLLKASVSGVTDAAGLPVTTDGVVGSADDYILTLHAGICDWADVLGCTPDAFLKAGFAVKVELAKGQARLKVDLSDLLSGVPDGFALRIRGGDLRLPPTNPAACPGDNSTLGLESRAETWDVCQTGALVGMTGILTGQ